MRAKQVSEAEAKISVLQVVISILRQDVYKKPDRISAGNIVRALEYFGIQKPLWPTGQSIRLWAEQDRDTARRMVKEICAQLLAVPADRYARPACPAVQKEEVYHKFTVTKYEDETREFVIKGSAPKADPSLGVQLPSDLKAAVVAASKLEHLMAEFNERTFGEYSERLVINVSRS